VLQLETVDDPVPGPDEVVVELRAAGVNPADTYMRSGTYAMLPNYLTSRAAMEAV